MQEPQTPQDALDIFQSLMEKRFNDIMNQNSNNLRVGLITDINIKSRQLNIKVLNTGEQLRNVRYQRGASIEFFKNDFVLIASPDPKLKSQNFVVGVY